MQLHVGDRSPGQRRGAAAPTPPKAFVIQLKHISVQSYMETLEQLARNEKLREVLQQVPHAVNEEANAVTFIAPRELAELLMTIAVGLDRPNEFRMHQREMEIRERMMDRQMQELDRGAPGRPRPKLLPTPPKPTCAPRPGGPCCGKAAGPSPRPGGPGCGAMCGKAAGPCPLSAGPKP